MFAFFGGCVAGAFAMKYSDTMNCFADDGSDCDDDDGRGIALLTPGERKTTSSRATMLKQSSQKTDAAAYNEFVDNTSASHINFLSDIVARLWAHINRAGAEMIREMIEPTFQETLPGPLSTLKFTKLDLGNVPFVLDNILVQELKHIDQGMAHGRHREYLQFEWDVTWNSKCDIQLATDKIGGMAAISFGVKRITLSGRLQVIAKPLSDVLPCMDAIQFAFVNPPTVELDFTGLANLADMKFKIGGFSVVDIKGVVRGIVDDILAQSLVLPNRTVAPLVDNVDYRDIYCPAYKGLARVQLHSGRGFEIQKASTVFGKDDIPDVYVKIRLGAENFFQSTVVQNNCSPKWDPDVEFNDFLYCGRDQILEIQAWDKDSGTLETDDQLGVAYVTVGQVLLGSDRNGNFEVRLMKHATNRGKNDTPTEQYLTISLEQLSFTTNDLSTILVEEQKSMVSRSAKKKMKSKNSERVVGLTTVLISHAINLPFAKNEDAHTFVKLFYGTGSNRREIGATPIIPASLNPEYQTPFHFPLRASQLLEMNDDNDLRNFTMEMFNQDPSSGKETSLGDLKITYDEVKNEDHEEWSLRECRQIGKQKRTKLAFSISFAGVKRSLTRQRLSYGSETSKSRSLATDMDEQSVISGATNNMIRVRIVKGYGFESDQKAKFRKADIPDIYCMIKFGASPAVWRTATIKDSENPTWENETEDYVMESANQVLSIDVWDENRKSDDDYYGNARISIGKVFLNGGSLDVEVKQNEIGKKKAKLKKMLGRSGGLRTNKTKMFITVECSKL